MPTPTTVTQLIEGSGNNFHAKVARWFVANGWHTVVSPYYMDQTQAKARELDLVVEKLWPIQDVFGRAQGDVVVRLFVECKYIASEAVFWFAQKNKSAASHLVCGLGPFHANNLYTDKHHYLAKSPHVAKLFASSSGRAQENDPIFKALNQALNGTVAMRTQASTHPSIVGRRSEKLIAFNYPVVVCSSFTQLYAVDFLTESTPAVIGENFQLEVQYAFHDSGGNQCDEYFLIDFVEFDQLAEFEASIAEGAKAGAYLASD